ncbi:hypothetical protein [Micromonospora sp. NPDC005652]|uniref:hypothetical protein n=1 Tax=Micromonospora sp. NPDC005652 TaxID=3157046 RepID=UPI0034082FFE
MDLEKIEAELDAGHAALRADDADLRQHLRTTLAAADLLLGKVRKQQRGAQALVREWSERVDDCQMRLKSDSPRDDDGEELDEFGEMAMSVEVETLEKAVRSLRRTLRLDLAQ